MAEHHEDGKGGIRFEARDIEPKAIVRFGIILAVVTVVVALALVYYIDWVKKQEEALDPPPAPLARYEPGRQPPEPRLQRFPFADYEQLKAQEAELLASYAWADEKAGVVRIPIEEAMRLLAERGLPLRGSAASPAKAAAAGPEMRK